MQCPFTVGQKIVCVMDEVFELPGQVILDVVEAPVAGTVYTVREIAPGSTTGNACLALEEIPTQRVKVLVRGEMFEGNVLFPADAFRPVQTKKTDISIFTRMLTPSKAQA